MASTVQAELNVSNPSVAPVLGQLAELGDGLAQCTVRSELLAVTADIATPTRKARVLAAVYIVAAGANHGPAILDLAYSGTPGAGHCLINEDGDIEFANADAVTSCEVHYIPIEGELITETIQVTAGGVGTLNNARSAIQLVSFETHAPAATPAAKTMMERGILVGALGAGEAALQFDGTTIASVAAEAAAACTATVVYYAFPGVGTSTQNGFQGRLEAAVDVI